MCLKVYFSLWCLLFLTIPNTIVSGPVPTPEVAATPRQPTNSFTIQQQQQQHQQQQPKLNNNFQDAQLNTLSVYATNYDMIADKQNQNDKFKPSYKLPEMETNFMPIQNANNIAPDFAATMATHSPVLMQYLPQTINEGGVQYLQLIPSRPLMVPIGPYLGGHAGVQPLTYHQTLTPNNGFEFSARPVLSALPANMPPPAATPLVDVPASPMPAYGIQSYSGTINPYKHNHRINRETKGKQTLGPLNLNLNEYVPQGQHGQHGTHTQSHTTFNILGRP